MKKIIYIILIFTISIFAQKFDGLASTPPMGWNSWNTFATDIDAELIKDIADRFVEDGYKEAGYEYIVLDDGWMARQRDSLGFLVPHSEKFPNGIKPVIDYVHAKGLKFGLYSCAGYKTCAGYPASRGHEYQDAMKFARWGVDFLKYDWCNTEGLKAEGAYMTMRDALYQAGRPIVFSICEWGNNQPWEWGADIGHMWRVTGDIAVKWDGFIDHGTWKSLGVMKILHFREGIRKYAGPDHWNDYDMMEVGNGLTIQEDKAHFAMWAMICSPLIMGHDPREASQETIDILTNKQIIAVNQDSLGIPGFQYSFKDSIEIWAKPLADAEWAICFLNRNNDPYTLQFNWNEHSIIDTLNNLVTDFKNIKYNVRDLYQKKNIGTTEEMLSKELPPHGVLMTRLKPMKN